MMTDYTNKKVNFFHSKISVKISKLVYSNGCSKIYLCSDTINSASNYCLKICTARMDDTALCNLINTEILILLGLKDCPNVVQIIDYDSQQTQNLIIYFILLEYCENGTLAEMMTKLSNEKNSYSEPQIWKIIYQISTGLNALHQNKYAHRDIRPDNILISLDGTYKICDFGSAINKFYENMNNNIRNEIIFDVSRNTTQYYRAPEQVDLYAGYPINEKVDIWALGLILYSLLFDYQPFTCIKGEDNLQMIKGTLILTEEMSQLCSPKLINLLKLMTNPNPKERASAADVITYIETNKEGSSMKMLNIKKRSVSFSQKVSEATAKLFKRHSTQFWVLKLMDAGLKSNPKFKYIKLLVKKAWTKREKVIKMYMNISKAWIHYFSFSALKSLYVMHHYIFLGPPETLNPTGLNLDEFISFLQNIWSTRYSTDTYDKDEILKNANVTKFVVAYSEFLKNKIAYHSKYPYVENNYSLEHLFKKPNTEYSLLVDKKFITDTISLYSQIYQKFIQVPIIVTQISKTIDIIAQLFNEELISLFSLIFYILIGFKNYIVTIGKNQNLTDIMTVYDSQFIEITNKSKEYLEKFKKFRNEIHSSYDVIDFTENLDNSNVYIEYLQNLNNHLKFFKPSDFNLKDHFNTKSIVGIKLSRNIRTIIDLNLLDDYYQNKYHKKRKSQSVVRNTSSDDNYIEKLSPPTKTIIPDWNPKEFTGIDHIPTKRAVYNLENQNFSKGFDFSDEKFQNSKMDFDFDINGVNPKIPNLKQDNIQREIYNSKLSRGRSMSRIEKNTVSGMLQPQEPPQSVSKPSNNNILGLFCNNNNLKVEKNDESYATALSKINFNVSPVKNNNLACEGNRKVSDDRISVNSNVMNVLNDLFDSNKNCNQSFAKNSVSDNLFCFDDQMKVSTNKNMNMNMNMQLNMNKNPSNSQNKIQNLSQYDTDKVKKMVNDMDNMVYNHFKNNNIWAAGNVSPSKFSPNDKLNVNPNVLPNDSTTYFNINNANKLNEQINSKTQAHMNSKLKSKSKHMPFQNIPSFQQFNNNNQFGINNINLNQGSIGFPQNNINFQPALYNNPIPTNVPYINKNSNINQPGNTTILFNNFPNPNIEEKKPKRPLEEENKFETVNSQLHSDVSNINIYNIIKNYNEITLVKEENNNIIGIEKIANDFLRGEFIKPNLQWLISSKDITLGKQIGFGGSSEVFIGNYRGTEVAVKKLRILEVKEENLKEFKSEVSSLSMLRHPNLVLFMGAIAEQDNICIVTEYCAGGTLFNILHQRKEMIVTWELRIRILLDIAIGMNFLHTNMPPIIHRDLKSLNILLADKIEKPTDSTKIKISDFGLSKIIKQFDSGKIAMTGQLGTCHWMAPEVIENKDYTIKADVFSFGIIIWEMCTRKTPYQDMTQQQISFFVTVKKGRPDKSLIAPNTPAGLTKLMERCWDHEPNNRPSFGEIIEYLKKIMQKM